MHKSLHCDVECGEKMTDEIEIILCCKIYAPWLWFLGVNVVFAYRAYKLGPTYMWEPFPVRKMVVHSCDCEMYGKFGMIDQLYALITLVNKILSHERFVVFLT
jgi:hypothetical protein